MGRGQTANSYGLEWDQNNNRIKGTFRSSSNSDTQINTFYAIPDDSRISNETYNFNFAGQLPPDVQDLVQSLYPTNNNLADAFSSDYNNLYSDTVLEETNYKAQIFGQLLSKKLNDKLQQYLPPGSSYDQDNLNNIKKFFNLCKFVRSFITF